MKTRREKLLELKGLLSSFKDLTPDASEDYLKRQILAARLTAQMAENTVDGLIEEEQK